MMFILILEFGLYTTGCIPGNLTFITSPGTACMNAPDWLACSPRERIHQMVNQADIHYVYGY